MLDSGPSVTANTQLGKENRQAITFGTVDEVRGDKTVKSVEAQKVDQVNISNTDTWVILMLVLGWLLPSPNEMGRWIRNLFKRNKDG